METGTTAAATLVDPQSYAGAAGTWPPFLTVYCGVRQMGERFVLSGMDLFSVLNHTSASAIVM